MVLFHHPFYSGDQEPYSGVQPAVSPPYDLAQAPETSQSLGDWSENLGAESCEVF